MSISDKAIEAVQTSLGYDNIFLDADIIRRALEFADLDEVTWEYGVETWGPVGEDNPIGFYFPIFYTNSEDEALAWAKGEGVSHSRVSRRSKAKVWEVIHVV